MTRGLAMQKNISLWQFLGFGVTSLLGTLLHFLYNWTGQSVFVSPFSAINESTWEHMKILFFPMFLFALVQSFFFKQDKRFWCIKSRGIVLGLMTIPVLFYTLNGIFGTTPDFINITIFFVAAAVAYAYETRLFQNADLPCTYEKFGFLSLCVLAILFVIFTFAPPQIPLFGDPVR